MEDIYIGEPISLPNSNLTFKCSWLVPEKFDDVDAEISCILYNGSKKLLKSNPRESMIYYGNSNHSGIAHLGEVLDMPMESESIKFTKKNIPQDAKYAALVMNIHSAKVYGRKMELIKDIKITWSANNKEICGADIIPNSNKDEGIVLGVLDLANWKFNLLGTSLKNASDIIIVARDLKI